MISAQTLCVCREGKPVSTFPDHALGAFCFRTGRFFWFSLHIIDVGSRSLINLGSSTMSAAPLA
jgi:hypothetical protein